MADDTDDVVGPPDYSQLLAAAAKGRESLRLERLRKQNLFVELVRNGASIKQAILSVGIKENTYKDWRRKDQVFRSEVDACRYNVAAGGGDEEVSAGKPWRERKWTFPEFRLQFFGLPTPGFQILMCESFTATPLGNIALHLVPPEHGKTTLFEDYSCFQLGVVDPQYRFLVGSEGEAIAAKILQRIQNRMEPSGPFPAFVSTFGPFVPQIGTGRKTHQVWNKTEFNVYKKMDQDERDYSMKALGLLSSVVSTRTDHLHGDDLMSKKTLSQSAKLEETFRQDWLTRSGESAPCTINGTRVGDDDIYWRLMNDPALGPDILRVVRLPAIVLDPATKEPRPLFPRQKLPNGREVGFTMAMLDRLRRKVGEDAWDRNYMQRDSLARAKRTFTDAELMPCLNPLKSLHHPVPKEAVLMLSLDPAIGGHNVVAAFRVDEGKMELVGIREQTGLMSNEAIMAEVEQLVIDMTRNGAVVSDLVIEAKNFQAGLSRDLRLEAMRKRYGFRVLEHQTGVNKYDENIGVTSMVHSFVKEQFELPYAADDYTRYEVDATLNEFRTWRPNVRGTKLKMDRVMAFWFAWIIWRDRASVFTAPQENQFKVQGLPYRVRPPAPLTSGRRFPVATSGAGWQVRGRVSR